MKAIQGRLAYVHLDKPHAAPGVKDAEPKYQCCIMIPKTDTKTISLISEAIGEAKTAGTAKWGKAPTNLKKPIKDGDAKNDEGEPLYPDEFHGHIFFNATTKQKLVILNRLKEEIPADQVYSGCYALVNVNFFPYDTGSKGIAAGLNGVLKTYDGERLGGGPGDGRNEFDDIDIPEEPLNMGDLY